MTTLWDPRRVLDVHPSQCGFTCTGITKKGARCRNSFISNADKAEASNILDSLARSNVIFEDLNSRISPKLVRLAELTLCPRWHRASHLSQVDSVSLKWHLAVSEFCRAERRAMREVQNVQYVPIRVSVRAERNTSAVVGHYHCSPHSMNANTTCLCQLQPSPAHASIARPRTQQSHPTPDTPTVQSASASSRQASRSENHPPRPSTVPREPFLPPTRRVEPERLNRNTNDRQEQALRPSQNSPHELPRNQPNAVSPDTVVHQLPTPPQSPIPRRRQPAPHSRSAEPVPAVEGQTSPLTARPTRSQRPASVPPNRKPLAEACYVCYEPFSGPGDAVWCRGSCGQNLHRECFEQWSSGKGRRHVKCAFWYVEPLILAFIVTLMIHIRSRSRWVY